MSQKSALKLLCTFCPGHRESFASSIACSFAAINKSPSCPCVQLANAVNNDINLLYYTSRIADIDYDSAVTGDCVCVCVCVISVPSLFIDQNDSNEAKWNSFIYYNTLQLWNAGRGRAGSAPRSTLGCSLVWILIVNVQFRRMSIPVSFCALILASFLPYSHHYLSSSDKLTQRKCS